MFQKKGTLIPMIAMAISLTTLLAVPVGAAPVHAPAATIPIDDAPGGNPDAVGVNVIRNVSNGEVIVRLTRGDRQAHFNIVVHGVEVTGIDDNFPGADGLDGGFTDGIWGGCLDELITGFAVPKIAEAKFYTCGAHDTVRLHIGEIKMCPIHGMGVDPAIRIVFREMTPVNTDGVFVGTDPTNVGSAWIPLYE